MLVRGSSINSLSRSGIRVNIPKTQPRRPNPIPILRLPSCGFQEPNIWPPSRTHIILIISFIPPNYRTRVSIIRVRTIREWKVAPDIAYAICTDVRESEAFLAAGLRRVESEVPEHLRWGHTVPALRTHPKEGACKGGGCGTGV